MLEYAKKLANHLRRAYYTRKVTRQVASAEEKPYVGSPTDLNENTELGKNTHFNGMKVWGEGRVVIGDNFHSGPGCLLRTMTHRYDDGDAIPYDGTYDIDEIIIEDNVWLGQNVSVLPGTVIGEGAIVQMGSVVIDDIPKYGIAGGHPAKVFSYRDKEHYERLKADGKFH